jgi:hypothetical protein
VRPLEAAQERGKLRAGARGARGFHRIVGGGRCSIVGVGLSCAMAGAATPTMAATRAIDCNFVGAPLKPGAVTVLSTRESFFLPCGDVTADKRVRGRRR